MDERLNYATAAPDVYKTMLGVHRYLERCGLDERLLNLIYLRASQLNGCAYCIDMHWKDLRAMGQSEDTLYMLNAWPEAPGYTERERAALEWTESVTLLTEGHVPDEVYALARKQFSDEELVNLTLAVALINSWNRLCVAFRAPAGSYQPAAKRRKVEEPVAQ